VDALALAVSCEVEADAEAVVGKEVDPPTPSPIAGVRAGEAISSTTGAPRP
jgi:hypothetical protein